MKNVIITGASRGIGFDLLKLFNNENYNVFALSRNCLLYTSPSPRDRTRSRMPSSA